MNRRDLLKLFGVAATVPFTPDLKLKGYTAKVEIGGTIDPGALIGVFVCDKQGIPIETLGCGELREVGRTFWARPGQEVTVRLKECPELVFFDETLIAPGSVTYARKIDRNYLVP